MPNRLQHESSPYLLQHAHNPVDWYPWGEEAFDRAVAEDKPVLVSIGYAACHWCHVMERESFEDQGTASLMNERFINVKIDREERPDLDHIYMDAVQAMTGSGGWPLNVFLTPQKKPFYGGTYFPPRQVFNRPSWTDVLMSISESFREKRGDMETQADHLVEHMVGANNFANYRVGELARLGKDQATQMAREILKTADKKDGGFGRAPKFPQTFAISFLLHHHYHTNDEDSLRQASLSLDKMIAGGIYDQLGGGFSRYSTDAQWLAPHFEKMLYDNALLIISLSEAYQITGKEHYKRVIDETINFVKNELMSPEMGFFSALDADSEGVEGKFYTWSLKEIESVLGADAGIFSAFYGVSAAGNWEHTNILHIRTDISRFAAEKGIGVAALEELLARCRQKLLERRATRVRPQLDDKILLGWNALMNLALARAGAATGEQEYQALAVTNMKFLLKAFRGADEKLLHTYKNNLAKYPAFLDDYAYLIMALVQLQEVTGDPEWLRIAKSLTELVIQDFSEEGPLFYFTSADQKDVIIRKKEIYDGAVPSGNAVMMWNLYQLGTIFDLEEWRSRSLQMAASVQNAAMKYPGSFSVWASFLLSLAFGIPEIAILGEESTNARNDFLRTFIGSRVFQSASLSNEEFPLLAGKPGSPKALFFLCKDYACQAPTHSVKELLELLKTG